MLLGFFIAIGYLAILAPLAVLILVRGDSAMKRVALTLAAVCAAGWLYQGGGWDMLYHPVFMVVANTAACWVTTHPPAGRWQSLIGMTFLLQIGADIGRIVAQINLTNPDMTFAYWATTVLAFLQLAFVGGWCVHGKLDRNSGWVSYHPLADPGYRSGVA